LSARLRRTLPGRYHPGRTTTWRVFLFEAERQHRVESLRAEKFSARRCRPWGSLDDVPSADVRFFAHLPQQRQPLLPSPRARAARGRHDRRSKPSRRSGCNPFSSLYRRRDRASTVVPHVVVVEDRRFSDGFGQLLLPSTGCESPPAWSWRTRAGAHRTGRGLSACPM